VIFGFFRLVLTFLVVYIVLSIARGLLIGLGLIRQSQPADGKNPPKWQETETKPKEDYKDVQEAKFKDISKGDGPA
jgi:hypothetical protein